MQLLEEDKGQRLVMVCMVKMPSIQGIQVLDEIDSVFLIQIHVIVSRKIKMEIPITTKLERAFTEASKLSSEEQNILAEWLLAELTSEKRWSQLFANSQDVLATLGKKALDEHRKGKIQELDPEKSGLGEFDH